MSIVKTYAEFYLYGLMESFVSPKDVVAWADSVVEREAHPEIEVIDISVCSVDDIHEVIRCLGAIRGTVDQLLHFRLLMAFYRKRYAEKKDLSRAVGDLWHLSHHKAATKNYISDAATVDEMADYVFERLKPESELRELVELVFEKYREPNL